MLLSCVIVLLFLLSVMRALRSIDVWRLMIISSAAQLSWKLETWKLHWLDFEHASNWITTTALHTLVAVWYENASGIMTTQAATSHARSS